VVKSPKSDAGVRDVTIPSHILGDIGDHLREHVGNEPNALLFPGREGQHLAPSSLYRSWYPARAAAGRSDLRFHDLRHTGQTLAAATGATLRELMARAGQSSPGAALRYLHEVDGRQREIADALAGLATVTPITTRRKGGATA
jgi:integrase